MLLGDREFCSVELANWLRSEKISFCLRLKISTLILRDEKDYQSLRSLELKPGTSLFLSGVRVTKRHEARGFSPLNIACYWAAKVRKLQPGEGWYILTDQDSLREAVECYAQRRGIEVWHKDIKTGGYHLESVRVNWERMMGMLLLAAIGWSIAMMKGIELEDKGLDKYARRSQEKGRSLSRHSTFRAGQYGQVWAQQLEQVGAQLEELSKVCSNKAQYYQRGREAAKLILSRTYLNPSPLERRSSIWRQPVKEQFPCQHSASTIRPLRRDGR